MHPLANTIDQWAVAALGKGWADHGRLLAHWTEIAGEDFARHTTPVKLAFPPGVRTGGTLTIAVPQALALEIQHDSETLLARINAFFGYRAIARVSFTPKRREPHAQPPVLRPLSRQEKDAVAHSVANITDEGVRDALAALGETLLAKR